MVGSVSSPLAWPPACATRSHHVSHVEKTKQSKKKRSVTELMSQRSSFSRLFDPTFNGAAVPSVVLLLCIRQKTKKKVVNDAAGLGVSLTSPIDFFFYPVAINMPCYYEADSLTSSNTLQMTDLSKCSAPGVGLDEVEGHVYV